MLVFLNDFECFSDKFFVIGISNLQWRTENTQSQMFYINLLYYITTKVKSGRLADSRLTFDLRVQ